jgi:hypothetical protein
MPNVLYKIYGIFVKKKKITGPSVTQAEIYAANNVMVCVDNVLLLM